GVGWGVRGQMRQVAAAKAEGERRAAAKDLSDKGRALVDLAVEDDDHGRLARRDGRLEDAGKLLRKAIELVPGDGESYYQLGRLLALSGRNREALLEFRRATDRNPAHALAWFEHGRIALNALGRLRNSGQLRAMHRISEAGLYDRVKLPMALDDGGLGLGAAELADVAAKDFDRVLASEAAPEKAAYGRAMLKLLDDDPDGAMKSLLEALERNKYDAEMLRAAAEIETYRGRLADAIEWRNRLLGVRPASPAAKLEAAIALTTGRTLLQRDLFRESAEMKARARKLVEDALSGEDRDARLLLFAATVLAGLDEIAAALPHAREAERLARTPAERRDAAVAVIALLAVTKPDEALQLLDARPGVITGEDRRALRISLLLRCRREAEAVLEWRLLAEGTELWHTRLNDGGAAELACGNLRAAEACARRIADPPRWWNSTLLAVILAAQGRTAEAIPLLATDERALGMDLYMTRAEVYWLAGRYRDSCIATQDAVQASAAGDEDAVFVKVIEKLALPLETDASDATAAGVLSKIQFYNALTLGADPTLRRDLLQGNWAALERMYAVEQEWTYRIGETAKSIEAGKRLLDLHRAGLWLFRDARARAKAGDREGALKALAEAVENGFDEEEWLDGEAGFDSVRSDGGFQVLREKVAGGASK
ncbi:MAG: tetratricopeptide repeat protein, partial [Planctomycetota bacterium]